MTAAPETTGTGIEGINRSEAVAEVTAAFDRYETALSAGDVATLNELFWHSALSVRFGVGDRQQGIAEIAAWRRAHPGVPPGRRLRNTQVLTIDDRTAVVTTLFDYPGFDYSGASFDHPNEQVEGRQTQVWVRFPAGWRIVSAHVSEVPATG